VKANHLIRIITVAALALAALGALLTGCAHWSEGSDRTAVLSLSYKEFDQTPHAGWRVLAEDGQRLLEAAALIEAYLTQHTELDPFQRSNLHWHAAHALAVAGDTAAARKHVSSSRLDPEPPSSPVRWNDYVAATEGFLQHDRTKLIAARANLAKSKPDDPNLPIVDSLITHFDEPYSKAYKGQGR